MSLPPELAAAAENIEPHGTDSLALDLLIILACAGLVALVLGRLRLSVIPGYLIAGAVIGPHAIGLLDDSDRIEEISGLAIVLLMFGIGLHLDSSILRRGAVSIVATGVLSTAATASLVAPALVIGGLPWPTAVAIALAVSMSSTAAVLRILQQKRQLYTSHGRLTFGVLLIQDLLVVLILPVLPFLAAWSDGEAAPRAAGAPSGLMSAMLSLLGVLALIVVGTLVLPRLMAWAARAAADEVMLVVAAAAALCAAVVTGMLGFSPELGAFIAGFLLSGTPFRFHLSGQVTPLRDLFMAVFFTAVGLNLNLHAIAGLWWVALLGVIGLLLVKSITIGVSAWIAGAAPAVAARTGLSLSQGGEFSLVLLAAAGAVGLVEGRDAAGTVAVVVASLIVTPPLISLSRRVGVVARRLPPAPWVRATVFGEAAAPAGAGAARPCPVLIAGFGPVGRTCAERLERAGVPYTVIELNPRTVRRQIELGRSAIYGDATNREVLHSAGIEEADAVLLTMPDDEAMLRGCRVVRSIRPDIFIAARANVLSRALRARELGADHITVEEIATADMMAGQVLEQLGRRRADRATAEREAALGASG